jgi:hypothetical protein
MEKDQQLRAAILKVVNRNINMEDLKNVVKSNSEINIDEKVIDEAL